MKPKNSTKLLTSISFLFIGSLFFTACKKEDPIPNRAPGAFTAEATLAEDGTTVNLSWTKAIDPDGDAISYTLILGDTLVKSQSDTTYIITDLGYDVMQDGKIIATDPDGLSSETSFSVSTANPYFAIPDAAFEAYLVAEKIDTDGTVNGKMALADTEGVTEINCFRKGIESLEGIERFVDLILLDCSDNTLRSLDLSQNVNLESLYCENTSLSTLDLSQNVMLEQLLCSNNSLSTLDLSKSVNLRNLDCGSNSLSTLDLSQNVNLRGLNCDNNSLSTLDLSQNVNLLYLYCKNNSLSTLDLSQNVMLEQLLCSYNSLSTLDLSESVNLEYLSCYNNSLSTLDLSKSVNLEYLDCFNNSLNTLDLSNNVKLESLYCNTNPELRTICVADITKALEQESWHKDDTAEYKICD